MTYQRTTATERVAAIALACAKQDLTDAAARSEVIRAARAWRIYSVSGLTDVAGCLATCLVASIEAAEQRTGQARAQEEAQAQRGRAAEACRGHTGTVPARGRSAEQRSIAISSAYLQFEQHLRALDVVQKLAHGLRRG